jgi:hypothetical protein
VTESDETSDGSRGKIGWILVYVGGSAVLLGLGTLAGYGLATYGLNIDKTAEWIGGWSKTAGFAGSAALVAAVIALFAQRENTRGASVNSERARWSARENALRKEWWDRTAWCLEQVQGSDELTRSIGIRTLQIQFVSGTEDERSMLRPVIAAVQAADVEAKARSMKKNFGFKKAGK